MVEASRSLHLSEAMAVGNVHLTKSARQTIMNRWSRVLEGPVVRKPQKLTFGLLRQMGIPVKRK